MNEIKEFEIIPIYYDYVLTKNYPVNILVGGRNSGKSYFMEQLSVMKLHNNENYKLLVIEDVEVNIGAGVKDGIENRIEEFGYNTLFRSVKQPPSIAHVLHGGQIIFKGYHSKEQQKQVKSLNEVNDVWYEEAENITYEQFKALRMQMRGKQDNRQLFLTLNPINEGGFICQYFFQGEPDKIYERFADGRPKVFEKHIIVELGEKETREKVIIPCMIIVSTHWDNPYLTKEQRADIEELKYKDKDQHAMLAEGRFVKGKGVYFQEFEKHIHVIGEFIRPQENRVYRVLDYGLDKLACYWVDVNAQGKAKFYKEVWQSDLIISEAAKKIKEMTVENVYRTLAPPDLWNRRQDTGKSAEQIFRDNGITLTKADNSFEQGCFDLKEWLSPYPTKNEQTGEDIITANLQITKNCPELIRSIESVVKDEKNPNVYSKEPHIFTHSVDALRYFCAGRPSPNKAMGKQQSYNFDFEKPKARPTGYGETVKVI